ncbi:signal transduction histidine kinase [Deinococcus metalli]|uniref:histidine kinase n=1 Tax=Deinococcus metalli TaxID=1141878 RepID=A0A7W8KHU5_9DEIO|nr:HAMP domain-containing sensor histidine kinase [Deinococcus metalli]MBB5378447.1 signal transduction histidine kinase [Deinococcus metalli]GHF57773.1 two-component sensor histidine kinase [Deinococcus metalli]
MTLRARVALLMALGIALAVLLQGGLGYLAFRRLVLHDMTADLNGFTGQTLRNLQAATSLASVQASYEGYVVHARILEGNTVVHDFTGYPDRLGTPAAGPQTIGPWQVTRVAFIWHGQSYVLEAALTSPEFTSSLHNYRQTVYFTAVLVTLLGAAVAYALSGYALRPLRALTRVSSRIATSGSLHEPVPVGGGSGELHDLAVSFNRMLARLGEFRDREARFTRQAAHELRTPLTAMGLALDAARSGYTTPDETLDILEHEVRATQHLTASLLILAREGRLAQREAVDLAEVASTGAEAAGATYRGPAHAMVQGDGTLLRRALQNLLENAARYAPGAPVTVTVKTAPAPTLKVEDGGPGLPDSALRYLGEEFYRAGTTLTGTGLGLSVVKHVMQAHQGSVTFTHVVPHGLQVTLHFPDT